MDVMDILQEVLGTQPAITPAVPAAVEQPARPPRRAKNKEQFVALEHSARFATAADVPDAIEELLYCDAVSLDLETTALTPWERPTAVGKVAKIGGTMTVNKYCKTYACSMNNTPRARILTIHPLPAGTPRAFDLDYLDESSKKQLIAALSGKTWVGHNLAFDMQWLRSIDAACIPAFMIDTMLLSMTHAPDLMYAISEFVASGAVQDSLARKNGWQLFDTLSQASIDALGVKIAQKAAMSRVGDGADRGVSLDTLSLAFCDEKLDKSYQKPQNWMPAKLSDAHFEYCLGDTTQPPRIAAALLGLVHGAQIAEIIDAIRKHKSADAYARFVSAAIALSIMQSNGIRFDTDAAAHYASLKKDAAASAYVELIAELPALAAHKDALLDAHSSRSDELKEELARALFEKTGVEAAVTDAGNLQLDAKTLQMTFGDIPALAALRKIDGNLKAASMAEAYAAATHDERLHALTTISTVTGRTSSQSPNLQNAPRGADFRAIFRASPGNKIVAIDYSAIELAIAAALTVRAYRTFKRVIVTYKVSKTHDEFLRRIPADLAPLRWILTQQVVRTIIATVENSTDNDERPEPMRPADGAQAAAWREYYGELLCVIVARMCAAGAFRTGDRLTLQSAFANKVDPHLVTAVATEALAGRFDTRGQSALDYIASLNKDEQKSLKDSMKHQRQAAKSQNFGLLYGMSGETLHKYGITNYGLTWAVEDALLAREGWFKTYPEISLWHFLTRFSSVKAVQFGARFGAEYGLQKIFYASTLSGRTVAADTMNAALNYQDQGSGAEIALSALSSFPQDVLACLVNFVHDEFVFECAEDRVEHVAETATQVMLDAANRLLEAFGVSASVEAAVGDVWIH